MSSAEELGTAKSRQEAEQEETKKRKKGGGREREQYSGRGLVGAGCVGKEWLHEKQQGGGAGHRGGP